MEIFPPSFAQDFHLGNDSFPDLFTVSDRICPGSCPLLDLCKKSISNAGALVACADIFPLVQLIFVKSQLEIMCTGKQFAAAQFHGEVSVLNDGNEVVPGIHQRSKKQIVKIIIRLFRSFFFYCDKSSFFLPGEKDPCGLRAG